MTFKLLNDRIAVDLEEIPQTTPSGIVLPDSAQEHFIYGRAVVVGFEAEHVKPGDRLFFMRNLGRDFKIDGVTYYVIKESDILGISDTEGVA